MAYPQQDAERIFRTVIIAVAFTIGAAVTLAITGPTILDSNPTSYIIVTMLMGILFIFFTLKDPSPITNDDYGIIGAIIAFVIYLVILSYASVALSFEFISYRIDALLLPLLLLSIVSAVSGFKGIKKYMPVMIYLLFASPLILMPLLISNGGLSSFSAGIVYSVLKATGAQVIQNGLEIISSSGQAISIASTCVPIGTFVALVMLLVPVAYLYKGSQNRKLAWLVCGVALLFVLNIIRMVVISLSWAYYGIGSAVATFHTFGGALIFYITIIVMLLLYSKFGLKLDLGKNWMKRIKSAVSTYDIEENFSRICVAFIIALAVLLLSLGYLGSTNVSAALFTGMPISNSTYHYLYQNVISRVNASGVGYSYLGNYNGSMLFEVGRGSPSNSTYLVVSFYPYAESGANILSYSGFKSPSAYLLKSGITVTSVSAISNNTQFYLSYFAVPMTVNGNVAVSANFELFSPTGSSATQYCSPSASSGITEYIESGIYNLLKGRSNEPVLCAAEKIALS